MPLPGDRYTPAYMAGVGARWLGVTPSENPFFKDHDQTAEFGHGWNAGPDAGPDDELEEEASDLEGQIEAAEKTLAAGLGDAAKGLELPELVALACQRLAKVPA